MFPGRYFAHRYFTARYWPDLFVNGGGGGGGDECTHEVIDTDCCTTISLLN